jgi:saccharopine dehydrogenase-like NADP-dependent oxidoreductase
MKTILILGAGLSASSLIRYLLQHAEAHNWQLKIVDQDADLLASKINRHPCAQALTFNALDSKERKPHVAHADLVISMLPAAFHVEVAKDCIALGTPLITPSYISPEMRALDAEAKAAGILIMNEIGVDPGIDHMSAMRIIHEIQEAGAQLESFKSYCGGLIAPQSDTNPWHYKFTWNPRNVVLAGQGPAACYREAGDHKYLPYQRLFQQLERIEIAGYGAFDAYANRNSLSYLETYGIQDIPTIFRGTLRRPPYCQAWDFFVQLGLTDDSYQMDGSVHLSPRQFLNAFMPFDPERSLEEKVQQRLAETPQLVDLIEHLGFFDDTFKIGISNASPAQLLQAILVEKWKLMPGDIDMLVMYHEFRYSKNGKTYKRISSLVVEGEDERYTAMANTVGLPVAIAAKLMLTQQWTGRGVQLPVYKEAYLPILQELEAYGITFNEHEIQL